MRIEIEDTPIHGFKAEVDLGSTRKHLQAGTLEDILRALGPVLAEAGYFKEPAPVEQDVPVYPDASETDADPKNPNIQQAAENEHQMSEVEFQEAFPTGEEAAALQAEDDPEDDPEDKAD